jgi:hypothetical protein
LSGEIEADEVYIVAGHKGLPAEVAKTGRKGRRRRLKGKRGRGTLAGDKPPVLGFLQRNGEVVLHKRVNHSAGEYARDDDGDGFHEVHINSLEGFWALLRSWVRPHRGISQEKLPWYLGFFEFVHNVRRRGKALLHSLLAILVAP